VSALTSKGYETNISGSAFKVTRNGELMLCGESENGLFKILGGVEPKQPSGTLAAVPRSGQSSGG
jgi:hypothetical protein